MPITNYLPSSRLIQPGVCTSSTRPASPFEGQAIFETDTDRMLIWNGTTWVIPNQKTINPEGFELIRTQNFTTADPLDITSVFTDDYASYKIMLNCHGSATTGMNMQFFSGTNTLFSSGDYYRYGIRATGGNTISGLATSGSSAGIGVVLSNSTERTLFEITIGNVRNTARKYIYCQSFDVANGDMLMMQFQVVTSLLFTGLRFDASSGSITGDIQIYGYRNS